LPSRCSPKRARSSTASCRRGAGGALRRLRPCAPLTRPARTPQDADANARLDAALESYLRLLSAYFLLPAATRTLEYLIRRFKCACIHAARCRRRTGAR
jgi:hypothetical protein